MQGVVSQFLGVDDAVCKGTVEDYLVEQTFHFPDVGGGVFGYEFRHFVGEVEVFVRGFHFEYGDARFHIRRLNVHRKPPRKTRAQTLFQRLKVFGSAVGGEYDLFVGLIQVVEDVEESLLCCLLSAEELYVVYHKHVAGTVFFTEAVAVLVVAAAYDADQLVDHGLRICVNDFCFRRFFEKIIPYRVQKVRLSESHSAVNEEGIVFSARIFRHGLCRGESVFVGFALHKSPESVFFEKRIAFFLFFSVFFVYDKTSVGEGNALFFQIFAFLLLDDDLDVRHERIQRRDHFPYLIQIITVDSLFGSGGLCREHKSVVDKTHRLQRIYPHIVAYRLQCFGKFVFNVVPKIFFSDHRCYYK